AIYGGAVWVNIDIGSPLLVAAGVAMGNTIGPLLTTWILRTTGFRHDFSYRSDILWFIVATVLGMIISASGGVTTLWWAGRIATPSLAAAWWSWWIGDILGILLLATVLLTISRDSLASIKQQSFEVFLFVPILLAVNWFIFLSPFNLTLAYVPVLLVMWAALRYGIVGASLTVLADSLIAFWGTFTHHGPFHLMGDRDQIVLAIYIVTHTVVSLVITALHAENRRAAAQLQQSYQKLNKITSRIPGMVYQFQQQPDGAFSLPYTSEAVRTLFEVEPQQAQEDISTIFNRVHPDDLATVMASIHRSAQELSNWQQEFRVCHRDGSEHWLFGNSMPERGADGTLLWYGFITDITPQKEVNDELRRAKEKAEVATRAKSDFLAVMSHEIRTPMNAVIGMGDVLLETSLTEEQRRYVHKLQSAGNNLLELINQILDLSKIEAGGLTIVSEPVQMRPLLTEVVALLSVIAEGKGLRCQCHVDETLPEWLIGDRMRLRQVLVNLLGNAIKFTERGQVSLSCRIAPDESARYELLVADTGVGVDSKHANQIFEAFSQVDSSITRHHGGSGLGLAISRQLVTLMGGELWLESQPGQGSLFRILLPLHPCACVVTDASRSAVVDGERQRPLRVLLVEDAEDNQLLIQLFLSKTPHHLTIAGNGEEAVQLVQQGAFDVVLMDVQMPVMDGYTATRLIRRWEQQHHLPRLPIITLTAHALEGEIERSRQAGCDLYLTKPIKKLLLLEAIQRLSSGSVDGGHK
ncbi:MAG: MASE1 domain-containing protein, partial [Magnetococcales bacterium]|nr:MASE1 domain-containing protein [Magnetococcales bacterium]